MKIYHKVEKYLHMQVFLRDKFYLDFLNFEIEIGNTLKYNSTIHFYLEIIYGIRYKIRIYTYLLCKENYYNILLLKKIGKNV